MSLKGCGLKNSVLPLILALAAIVALPSCGGSSRTSGTSGLKNRLLVSQSVSAATTFGNLVILNGEYDTLTHIPPISAGRSPTMIAISPDRNIVAAFDSASNSVFVA